MSGTHTKNTDGSSLIEFCNNLKKLYQITVDYRIALKTGNEQGIIKHTESLFEAVQKLYFSREYNERTNPELANMAGNITEAFNDYTAYYNAFVDSTDRLGSVAQENAKNAEFAFSKFVNLITTYSENLSSRENTNQNEELQNNTPAIPPIIFNPQINILNHIENIINISVVFETAIQTAQSVLTDEKERQEVLKQIEELKGMINDRNNKKRFCEKLKEKLKWLAEKSIQVAGIIVPVVAALLKP